MLILQFKKYIIKYIVDILTSDECSLGSSKNSVQPLLNTVKSSKTKVGASKVGVK